MTDLTESQIRDLLAMGEDERVEALKAMLPNHPEHMLGRWATHPEYGAVVCLWDKPNGEGYVLVRWRDEINEYGSSGEFIDVSELTFPHQATRPEDVPVGEAWLVNANDENYSYTRVVALKDKPGYWRTAYARTPNQRIWCDSEVSLISPLVTSAPGTPATPEPEHPATLSSVEDYEAAPVGTIVASPDNNPWVKLYEERWVASWTGALVTNARIADKLPQNVLRWGWGDE